MGIGVVGGVAFIWNQGWAAREITLTSNEQWRLHESVIPWVWSLNEWSWVCISLVTSCPGYKASWARDVPGMNCFCFELSWVRDFLGTSCVGYELSRSRGKPRFDICIYRLRHYDMHANHRYPSILAMLVNPWPPPQKKKKKKEKKILHHYFAKG